MKILTETPAWIFYFHKFVASFIFLLVVALFLPWQQFTSGKGRLVALNPNERIQEINAPIDGLIKSWSVSEGMQVKAGDVLVELGDNDPALIERLEIELSAAERAFKAAELALDTGRLNLNRQKELLEKGLTSSRDYEKVKIEVSKHQMEHSKAQTLLAYARRNLARQQSQVIRAPRDGTIVRLRSGEGGLQVKTGEVLIIFAPSTIQLAVELWINANDVPLVKIGDPVRIQLAGWPAVQTPGWPGLAIGTFKGKVHLVDTASSYMNQFRVLIVPDEVWPSEEFLKQGTLAQGFINFGIVSVGAEIWRIFNGIPPQGAPIQDELEKIMKGKTDNIKDNY